MPQIRPITDLKNGDELSALCHESDEPVYITKDGYGDMVVMSMKAYQRLLDEIEIDKSIAEAEADYAESGILLDGDEVLEELRKKHLG